MRSSRSKLLHEIAGRSMLSYAVDAANALQPEHVVVVVGHLREQVEAHLAEIAPHVTTVVQTEQRGTGHAVQVALASLPGARRGRAGDLRRRADADRRHPRGARRRPPRRPHLGLRPHRPGRRPHGLRPHRARGRRRRARDRRGPRRHRGPAGDRRDQLRHLRLRGGDAARRPRAAAARRTTRASSTSPTSSAWRTRPAAPCPRTRRRTPGRPRASTTACSSRG